MINWTKLLSKVRTGYLALTLLVGLVSAGAGYGASYVSTRNEMTGIKLEVADLKEKVENLQLIRADIAKVSQKVDSVKDAQCSMKDDISMLIKLHLKEGEKK